MAEKFTTLYIETNTGPRTALRTTTGTSARVKTMDPIVYGDTMNLNLVLMNNGVIDTDISGAEDYFITASVGKAGGYDWATSTNWYVSGSYGYTGSIEISSSAMSASLASQSSDSEQLLFELQLVHTGSLAKKTYLQTPVQVYKEVIE